MTFLLRAMAIVALGAMFSAWALAAAMPAGWQVENADGKFTFAIPHDLQQTTDQGTDSFVRRYVNDRMDLTFDYGPWTDPLKGYEDRPEYREETVSIDGRDARLITFISAPGTSGAQNPDLRYFSGVYIRETGAARTHLGMVTYSRSSDEQAVARKIFTSIRLR
jgi:hypothetical protein